MATTYMALTLPTPTVSTGPGWSSTLNTAITTIDSHDHTTGKGVQVPISGLNINADLNLNPTGGSGPFNLTGLRSSRYVSQSAALAVSTDTNCVYFSGGNFFINNSSGQAVQITSGSTLSATSLGGISGLPSGTASASFGSQTFTWRSATNTAASMDGGPVLIRDTALGASAITLQSPAGIASPYTLTLPAALPASLSLLSMSTGGVIGVPTGAVTANSQRITSVTDPSSAQDAATKNYVDSKTQSSALRFNADAADLDAQVNLTLSADTKFNSYAHSKTAGASFTNDGTGKITVTAAGTYRIFCSMTANPAAGSALRITVKLFKNGSALATVGTSSNTSVGMTGSAGMVLYDLLANDFIESYYFVAGGSAGTSTMAYAQLVIDRIV